MLRQQRAPTGSPTFALEHGLSQAELVFLKEQVTSSVRQGRVRGDLWIPLIVYASEIGYEYSGDEYWQTFEASRRGGRSMATASFLRRGFAGSRDPSGAPSRPDLVTAFLDHLLADHPRGATDRSSAPTRAPPVRNRRATHLGAARRSWGARPTPRRTILAVLLTRSRASPRTPGLLGRVAAAPVGRGRRAARHSFWTRRSIASLADLSHERQARRWLRGRSPQPRASVRRVPAPRIARRAYRRRPDTLPPAAIPSSCSARSPTAGARTWS